LPNLHTKAGALNAQQVQQLVIAAMKYRPAHLRLYGFQLPLHRPRCARPASRTEDAMYVKADLNSPTGKLVTMVAIAAVIGIAVISGRPAPQPSRAPAPGAPPTTARTKDIDTIKAEEALKRARESQAKGDLRDAFTWMRIAAVLGDAVAQAGLGAMYQGGQGVPQDYAQRQYTGIAWR
jgi:TPR repeat protein